MLTTAMTMNVPEIYDSRANIFKQIPHYVNEYEIQMTFSLISFSNELLLHGLD